FKDFTSPAVFQYTQNTSHRTTPTGHSTEQELPPCPSRKSSTPPLLLPPVVAKAAPALPTACSTCSCPPRANWAAQVAPAPTPSSCSLPATRPASLVRKSTRLNSS